MKNTLITLMVFMVGGCFWSTQTMRLDSPYTHRIESKSPPLGDIRDKNAHMEFYSEKACPGGWDVIREGVVMVAGDKIYQRDIRCTVPDQPAAGGVSNLQAPPEYK
jgi:hypothetical protein